MGHGVHGIVGTMDPHVDGHVMAGYENLVTWVRFPSRRIRGGCYKNGGGGGRMGRGKGDGVGAKHVLAGTLVPDAFISFGLFNILLPYQVVNTYING